MKITLSKKVKDYLNYKYKLCRKLENYLNSISEKSDKKIG